jgi:glycosyltransferase involved in cell wall biosynthesis
MHVLHAISSIDPRDGGPPTALIGLATAQAAIGVKVSVVSTYTREGSKDAANRLTQAGVSVHLVGPAKGPLQRHPDLIKTLETAIASADVVHIHALWEDIQHQAAKLARKYRKPYLIRPCGMLDPWSLAQGRFKKRAYMALRLRRHLNLATALHFTTNAERDLTLRLKLRAPSIVEPNGIDLAEFQNLPPTGRFRARHRSIGDRSIVLFLSRLHYKKGVDLLIPAFAQANLANAVLVIAGPGESDYTAKLQQLAAQHNITDRIFFTGMLRGRDRIEALVDADLFVLPSYQENFGIAVVEAMAAGKPVLISDQVNIHDQITLHQLGAVVPTQIDPLAKQLSLLMNDRSLLTAAGSRGRTFAFEHYNWAHIAARWSEHYQRLVSHQRPILL